MSGAIRGICRASVSLALFVQALTSWGGTINLQRDPRWGRNQETISSDPYMLSRYAVAFARGMQEGDDPRYVLVGVTFKHFAVYSVEDIHLANGSHITRENFNAVASKFDLYDTYFPHFKAGVSPVSAGGGAALGIMMAMNSINGTPCTANQFLIQQTLFDEWGMDGYITSDGGNMITDMVTPYPQGHGWSVACIYAHGPGITAAGSRRPAPAPAAPNSSARSLSAFGLGLGPARSSATYHCRPPRPSHPSPFTTMQVPVP